MQYFSPAPKSPQQGQPSRPAHYYNYAQRDNPMQRGQRLPEDRTIEHMNDESSGSKSSLGTLVLIGIIVLVILGGAGIGAYFFYSHSKSNSKTITSDSTSEHHGNGVDVVTNIHKEVTRTVSTEHKAMNEEKKDEIFVDQIWFKNIHYHDGKIHDPLDEPNCKYVGYIAEKPFPYSSLCKMKDTAEIFEKPTGWSVNKHDTTNAHAMSTIIHVDGLCKYLDAEEGEIRFLGKEIHTQKEFGDNVKSDKVSICSNKYWLFRDGLVWIAYVKSDGFPYTKGVALRLSALIFKHGEEERDYILTGSDLRAMDDSDLPSLEDMLKNKERWKKFGGEGIRNIDQVFHEQRPSREAGVQISMETRTPKQEEVHLELTRQRTSEGSQAGGTKDAELAGRQFPGSGQPPPPPRRDAGVTARIEEGHPPPNSKLAPPGDAVVAAQIQAADAAEEGHRPPNSKLAPPEDAVVAAQIQAADAAAAAAPELSLAERQQQQMALQEQSGAAAQQQQQPVAHEGGDAAEGGARPDGGDESKQLQKKALYEPCSEDDECVSNSCGGIPHPDNPDGSRGFCLPPGRSTWEMAEEGGAPKTGAGEKPEAGQGAAGAGDDAPPLGAQQGAGQGVAEAGHEAPPPGAAQGAGAAVAAPPPGDEEPKFPPRANTWRRRAISENAETSNAWNKDNMFMIIGSTIFFIAVGIQSFYWLSHA